MTTPSLSMSSKLYRERRLPCNQPTLRRPGLIIAPDVNIVHSLPLLPPYPLPAVVVAENATATNAGLTTPWVHGQEEKV